MRLQLHLRFDRPESNLEFHYSRGPRISGTFVFDVQDSDSAILAPVCPRIVIGSFLRFLNEHLLAEFVPKYWLDYL